MNSNALILSLSLLINISLQSFTHQEFKALSEEKKWEACKALQAEVAVKNELIGKYQEQIKSISQAIQVAIKDERIKRELLSQAANEMKILKRDCMISAGLALAFAALCYTAKIFRLYE